MGWGLVCLHERHVAHLADALDLVVDRRHHVVEAVGWDRKECVRKWKMTKVAKMAKVAFLC